MSERDKLHGDNPDPKNKLYVVIPTLMLKYMTEFKQENLTHPDMVVYIASRDLNPETNEYYGDDKPTKRKGKSECPVRSLD